MEHRDAVALLRPGVPDTGGEWADLGAGSGTFTRALAELLGPTGTVYAVDKVAGGQAPAPPTEDRAAIVPVTADFTQRLPLRDLHGVVMANALHYSRDAEGTLRHVVAALRPGGRLVLVEYDLRRGNPWVPYPVRPDRFAQLARAVGLGEPREIARRPSRYGPRDLYAAVATLEAGDG